MDEEWVGLIEQFTGGAQAAGEIDVTVDAAQLTYEFDSYLDSANLRSLLGRPGVCDQAARAVRDRLDAAATGVPAVR